jgi:hypothetical protein
LTRTRPDTEQDIRGDGEMHKGRKQTNPWPAHAGSRLKLSDALGRRRPTCQPSSRTGENPPYGMIGGSRRRRHHSKPGPRLDPTRLRGELGPPVWRGRYHFFAAMSFSIIVEHHFGRSRFSFAAHPTRRDRRASPSTKRSRCQRRPWAHLHHPRPASCSHETEKICSSVDRLSFIARLP